MILKNPDNGAPILKFASEGEYWSLNVSETLEFPDKVGAYMVGTFGFLEEVQMVSVIEDKELKQFRCSVCGFAREKKLPVEGHLSKHDGVRGLVEKASPAGAVTANLSVTDARNKKMQTNEDLPNGVGSDGVEVYGEGYQESRPGMYNLGGKAGRFGASR